MAERADTRLKIDIHTHQIPIEAATEIGRSANVLKCIHADDIDDGTYDTCWIFDDALQ